MHCFKWLHDNDSCGGDPFIVAATTAALVGLTLRPIPSYQFPTMFRAVLVVCNYVPQKKIKGATLGTAPYTDTCSHKSGGDHSVCEQEIHLQLLLSLPAPSQSCIPVDARLSHMIFLEDRSIHARPPLLRYKHHPEYPPGQRNVPEDHRGPAQQGKENIQPSLQANQSQSTSPRSSIWNKRVNHPPNPSEGYYTTRQTLL
ncbi:hypothetical protein J6590_015795 [Homalodisca vitripennis]|nr:hypothetical protein J6590_015795 [Homalodisca vitripennis]